MAPFFTFPIIQLSLLVLFMVVYGPIEATCEGVSSLSCEICPAEGKNWSVASWNSLLALGAGIVVIGVFIYFSDSYFPSSPSDSIQHLAESSGTGLDFESLDLHDKVDLAVSFMKFIAAHNRADLALELVKIVAEHADQFV